MVLYGIFESCKMIDPMSFQYEEKNLHFFCICMR